MVPGIRLLLLELVFATGSAAQDGAALASALRQFPDDGLPGLLARLAAGDHAAADGTRALGCAVHEAMLGLALSTPAGAWPRVPVDAFGALDASGAWMVPVLTTAERLGEPQVQAVLLRLGPAAAPAIDLLRARVAQEPWLAAFAEQLVRASDRRVPDAPTATPRPRVDPALVPALLGALRQGPEALRWPALQALLGCGDEAASDALDALLDLAAADATAAQARDLALALSCVYGARCLQGRDPLATIAAEDVAFEARRLALAGRTGRGSAAQNWLRSPNPHLRRSALIATFTAEPSATHWLTAPPDEADPAVRGTSGRLAKVARRHAARAAQAAIPGLGADGDGLDQAIRALGGADLTEAPEDFWRALLAAIGRPGADRNTVHQACWLLRNGAAPGLLPHLPELLGLDPNRQLESDLIRTLDLDALEAHLRRLSEHPAQLGPWMSFLGADDLAARQRGVLARVGGLLAEALPAVTPAQQVAWLRVDRTSPVDAAIWRGLFAAEDAVVRRGAVEMARRGMRERPVSVALLAPRLDDADAITARYAAFALAECTAEAPAAVAALALRFPSAGAELQQDIVHSLRALARGAAAAPPPELVAAAAASPDAKVRVNAAMLRLALDPADADAFAGLRRLLADEDAQVRWHAWFQAGSDRAVAAQLVDEALAKIDGDTDEVRCAVMRLCGNVPEARDRVIVAVRAMRQKAQERSRVASYADQLLQRLEHPPEATGR